MSDQLCGQITVRCTVTAFLRGGPRKFRKGKAEHFFFFFYSEISTQLIVIRLWIVLSTRCQCVWNLITAIQLVQSQKMLKYCRYNFGVRMLTHQQLDSMGHKNIYYYKKSEKKIENRKNRPLTQYLLPLDQKSD